LRLVLLKEIPEDEDLRRQWNALVDGMEQPQIFFTYEWALAVQRAYRETLRPLLILTYDDAGSLCGVAALATNFSEDQVSFLGATTGDYCDFLSLPEHRKAFLEAGLAELRKLKLDRVVLTNLPSDSSTVRAIQEAAGQLHYWCFTRTAYRCAQISLGSLHRTKGGKPTLPRKEKLRRFLNAMGREGSVRLDHGRSWEAIGPVLDQFMLAHVARFLITQHISNLARPERRMFLSELAKLLSAPGCIVLTRMMAREKAIAWNYGFQFHGTWFWYQPTFDIELEKYSPGFCLLAKIVEEAAENPALSVVDLGLGAEEYKERFANQTRETLHLTLQTSVLGHFREALRYHVATFTKASPRVEGWARWLRARLHELRDRLRQQGASQTLAWLTKRLSERIWGHTEVFFYEWSASARHETDELKLQSLDLTQLASAVIEHVEDDETLAYLLRSAQRLSSKESEGFALVDGAGRFLHFAWTTPFDGFFLSELNTRVSSPSPDSLMLFDSWTPAAARGRGYCGHAIALIADRQNAQGKGIWICSSASNGSAIREIEKGGFRRRYSLVRNRTLWWHKARGNVPVSRTPAAEVSAQV
jgi:CelD/BcsL family acetyltransferase involved in cellulose biosynthesis